MTARADKTASGGATFGLAAETDVPALVAIDSASPQGWTAKAFSAELKNDPPTLFVLRSAGQVLAFVRTAGKERVLVIHNLGSSEVEAGPFSLPAKSAEPLLVSAGRAGAPTRTPEGWKVRLPAGGIGIWRLR